LKNNQAMEFTEGSQIRQYLHTNDLVRFLAILIDGNTIKSGFYNIAPDEFYSVKDVVKLIFQELNIPFVESYFGRKSGRDESMKILCMNNSKMKSIGFQPKIDLISGIKKYL
jgi:nucleoside-diphosphate-sugar epimerase